MTKAAVPGQGIRGLERIAQSGSERYLRRAEGPIGATIRQSGAGELTVLRCGVHDEGRADNEGSTEDGRGVTGFVDHQVVRHVRHLLGDSGAATSGRAGRLLVCTRGYRTPLDTHKLFIEISFFEVSAATTADSRQGEMHVQSADGLDRKGQSGSGDLDRVRVLTRQDR